MKFPPYLTAIVALGSCSLSSCLSDSDIPYPNIQANIESFEVEGQTRVSVIDTLKRTVSIAINDSVNPSCLHVTRFTLAPGASLVTDTSTIVSGIDLTSLLLSHPQGVSRIRLDHFGYTQCNQDFCSRRTDWPCRNRPRYPYRLSSDPVDIRHLRRKSH